MLRRERETEFRNYKHISSLYETFLLWTNEDPPHLLLLDRVTFQRRENLELIENNQGLHTDLS